LKVQRKNDETGEHEAIELSPLGALRFLVFRNASSKQIAVTLTIIWRAVVAYTVIVMWGWASAAGWPPPYTKAEDYKAEQTKIVAFQAEVLHQLKQIKYEYRQDRLERIDVQIFEMRRSFCRERTATIKAQWAERVNELMRRYYSATQQWPRVPACDET
jgi:hypothetical protein